MAGLPTRPWSDLRAPLATALVVLLAACAPAPTPSIETSPTPAPSASQATEAGRTPTASVSTAPSPTEEDGGIYLAIGDSITFGLGVERPLEEGYVARVATALADGTGGTGPIADTRVFAVPGQTATAFVEERLGEVRRSIADAGARVELVTIGLGANELLRTRRDPVCDDRASAACQAAVAEALVAAEAALGQIVDAVRESLAAAGSEARVLLLAYYNPDPDPRADAVVAGADAAVACDDGDGAALNDRIACVAAASGADLVDLHAPFRGRELELTRFAEGDVHPNASGYAVIADTILARLAGRP